MLVTTGGGSTALNALLTTPGASRFVADAQIPYSPEALERFLGEKPEQSVSPETARALAEKAFFQGLEECRPGDPTRRLLGVACTAALQTDRARRGADRAFICIKTEQASTLYALHFSKTSREEQEALLSDWLLVLIALAVDAERGLMLPGSFNPLHQGHCNLLSAAGEITGLRGVFELSCANVDKPGVADDECLDRASQIKDIPVALTFAPRFVQKAELFPQTTFVLGYDTAARLIAPDYSKDWKNIYVQAQPASKPWKNQWEFFQTLETKFLVAGRLSNVDAVSSPRFQGLEELSLPEGFESLFEAIPESAFREDVSSTDLRG